MEWTTYFLALSVCSVIIWYSTFFFELLFAKKKPKMPARTVGAGGGGGHMGGPAQVRPRAPQVVVARNNVPAAHNTTAFENRRSQVPQGYAQQQPQPVEPIRKALPPKIVPAAVHHQYEQAVSTNGICRHFNAGRCIHDNCPFQHVLVNQTPEEAERTLEQLRRTNGPCKFFRLGKCVHDNCPFLHRDKSEEEYAARAQPAAPAPAPVAAKKSASPPLKEKEKEVKQVVKAKEQKPSKPKKTSESDDETSSGSEKSSRPCRYFLAGECKNGNSCPFAHVKKGGASTKSPASKTVKESPKAKPQAKPSKAKKTSESDDETSSGSDKSPIPCLYFLAGECKNGSDCKFAHVKKEAVYTKKPAAKTVKESPKAKQQAKSSKHSKTSDIEESSDSDDSSDEPKKKDGKVKKSPKPCSFFLEGKCKNGKDCKFAHIKNGEVKKVQKPTVAAAKPSAKKSIDPDYNAVKKAARAKKTNVSDSDDSDDGSSGDSDAPKKRKSSKTPRPCFFYLAGKCENGKDCKFVHATKEGYKPPLCKEFAAGECEHGANCWFSHGK